jgi:hypothetical protein
MKLFEDNGDVNTDKQSDAMLTLVGAAVSINNDPTSIQK